MNLVVKDAVWQILWRVASAVWWFLVIKLITPYLWPLRFGDYSTILKYFAIWSALADFWLYVLALKTLWAHNSDDRQWMSVLYGKFVSTRWLMIVVIYTLALVLAYLIPAYTSNIYLMRWIPLGMLFSAIWWSAYLSADGRIGSDWVLKWIGLVVLMSFIKQVHNYLFVSTGDQNILLPINLLGVGIGLPAAVLLIDRFELVWWLRAQWILEFLFLAGAVAVARYKRIPLTVPIVQLTALLLVPVAVILFVPQTLFAGSVGVHWLWIAQWWAVTAALTALSYKFLKVHAKGL
jgi:O-antigen/teichoic acid export membrane protein